MPNDFSTQTVHLGHTGNPETFSVTALPAAGQLGKRFNYFVPLRQQPGVGPVPETGAAKGYQIVQLDSAAATAGTRGALTWWKDRRSTSSPPTRRSPTAT